MAGTGGKRDGAGRKTKADETKVNTLFVNALKRLYAVDNDKDAKEGFILTLLENQRGQLFIAEHLFGKPKETIDSNVNINSFELKDIIKFK